MSRDFVGALLQLNAEKQVSREQLIHAVEDGIQSAYRRVAGDEDIHVRIDAETGRIRVFRARVAVAEVEDPLVEFDLEEARGHKPDAEIGDLVEIAELNEDVFGRIGAQTAKQIVLQRIREVERDQVFDRFASREGEMITGTVNRVEPRAIILDVGNNVEAILQTSEQSAVEHYRIGQNVKAYVLEVRRSTRGPQIFVSRTHKGFLKRLFELEVPEIHSGTVEIRAIAREAGSRSKVAVGSRQEGLDPVGATVGQRGARVQAVVAELGGEKIDVIPWNDDPGVFVANALSPAQVISVDIDEEHRIASVTVPERMLSLAIGREGQNARLAARLTGWRIDIRSDVSVAEAKAAAEEAARAPAAATTDEEPTADVAATAATGATDGKVAAEAKTAAPKKARVAKATAATASTETAAGADGTDVAKPVARKTRLKKTDTAAEASDGGRATTAPATTVAEPAAKKPRATKTSATAKAVATDGSASNGVSPDDTGPAPKKPRARKATAAAGGDGEASS
ncbi:MAG TPA: transcription termination factor NusA [Candidatus Dormibacteraeota bacterium]|nr:transcription termination factor NusA [Candidatus Dormibacteraeota bacterium]